ncbi:MAG TPA: hypothetical protein VFD42_03650 [Chloroflexota bacterium]|nr:hypothetical protein [Chloroflexota bacterium]
METPPRDFDRTTVYLDVAARAAARGDPWELGYSRRISALERLNRALRRMVRRLVPFHSDPGLEVRIYLVLVEAGEMPFSQRGKGLEMLEEQLAAA